MVEVGRVEPPSENALTGLSPGADGYCGSLSSRSPPGRQTVTPSGQVSFMIYGTGKAYRTHIYRYTTPFPARGPSGSDGRF